MAASEAESSASEPTAEEAVLEVEGASWSIRVLGLAGGGDASAVPLMLLGFWPGSEPEGDPRREIMTVGLSLEKMSESDLLEAFARARPWRPPTNPREGGERQRGERRDGATRRRRT